MRGTIFNELDDEKLHSMIDFTEFEEKFKLCGGGGRALSDAEVTDGLSSFPSKRFKKPDNISLLEHARLRNIGKSISSLIIKDCLFDFVHLSSFIYFFYFLKRLDTVLIGF